MAMAALQEMRTAALSRVSQSLQCTQSNFIHKIGGTTSTATRLSSARQEFVWSAEEPAHNFFD